MVILIVLRITRSISIPYLPQKKNTILHIHLKSSPNILSSSNYSTIKIDFIEQALGLCPSLLLQVNDDRETALHIAARSGHDNAVEFLIEHAKYLDRRDLEKADNFHLFRMLTACNKKQETPLHVAVTYDRSNAVKAILSSDPDHCYSGNYKDETPLYLAVERNNTGIVKEILNICNSVDYSGPGGKTALHAATLMHETDDDKRNVIDDILGKKRDIGTSAAAAEELIRSQDENGWTPLHYAVMSNRQGVVEKLLKEDITVACIADNERKRTPLHLAACYGYSKIAGIIISECIDCGELTDSRGWNVLHYAAVNNHVEQSDKVLQKILYHTSIFHLLKEKDEKGLTPLNILSLSRNGIAMPTFIEYGDNDTYKYLKKHWIDEVTPPQGRQEKYLEWLNDLGNDLTGKISVSASLDEQIPDSQKPKDMHLMIATLVATMSVAATFTVPGGFDHDGIPELKDNRSFQAFYIANAFAAMLAIGFATIPFVMALTGYHKQFLWAMHWGYKFLAASMAAMAFAFLNAAYATLSKSYLGIVTCAVCSGPIIFVLIFLIEVWKVKHKNKKSSKG